MVTMSRYNNAQLMDQAEVMEIVLKSLRKLYVLEGINTKL